MCLEYNFTMLQGVVLVLAITECYSKCRCDSDDSEDMSKAMKVEMPPESLQLWGVCETIYDCVDTMAIDNEFGECNLRTECNLQWASWRTTSGETTSGEVGKRR